MGRGYAETRGRGGRLQVGLAGELARRSARKGGGWRTTRGVWERPGGKEMGIGGRDSRPHALASEPALPLVPLGGLAKALDQFDFWGVAQVARGLGPGAGPSRLEQVADLAA